MKVVIVSEQRDNGRRSCGVWTHEGKYIKPQLFTSKSYGWTDVPAGALFIVVTVDNFMYAGVVTHTGMRLLFEWAGAEQLAMMLTGTMIIDEVKKILDELAHQSR